MSTRRQRVVTADQWGKPERDAAGAPVCRWCRGPVAPPRRTFCGDACVHEWKIRSSPWYVRREVKKRDKGTCRLCGLNVVKAHREWTRAKPPVTDRPRASAGAPSGRAGKRTTSSPSPTAAANAGWTTIGCSAAPATCASRSRGARSDPGGGPSGAVSNRPYVEARTQRRRRPRCCGDRPWPRPS